VQQAPFRVLVGANMPAVLVELGSLADPENEYRLTGAPFRNAVAEALLASIQRFGVELERGTPAGLPAGG
jgi:N-acetylmuramoyl-L-alanine amidase